MSRLFTALLVGLSLAIPGRAETPARTHDITVEDYFTLAAVTQVAVAPDGKTVAYAEGRWQKSTNDRKTDLWLVGTAGGQPKRLTFDRANDRAIKWAPDGKTIYFLSNRKREGEKRPPYDGKTQVWKIAAEGGEPAAVTRVEEGVDAYDLGGDGQSLYYTTEKTAKDDDEFSWLRDKHAGLEHGHGSRKVSVLWRLDLNTWRTEKVLDEKRNIREFAVTRDGKKIALITTPDERVITFEGRSRIDVLDTATGRVATLPDRVWRADAPSPYAWLETLAWSPNGKRLAFNAVFDAYPAEVVLIEWKDGRTVSTLLPRKEGVSIHGYGTPLQWRTDTSLCYLAERHGRVRIAQYDVDAKGGERSWGGPDAVVSAFSFSASGDDPVAVVSDATHFPDLHVLAGAGRSLPLTDLNSQTARWKLPQVQHVAWKGAGGVEVHGVLELPPGYEKGKKVPLVVGIHGGPTTAVYGDVGFNFYEGRTILPAHGYAVFCPNYRGSTGNGDKFVTDLIGHENDIEVEDILKGVDALVEQGIADPDKLGVMGWSNGGYLTNCLIAKTTRFKAASSGAGILDVAMEWGTNDEPAYPTVFKQGFPWEKPEAYRKTSPGYDLGKVRTPTLIHVGGNDERCPPGHSRMLYRALREYVKVPTELVVYPGEPHGLTKYAHRQAKMEWDLAWFDRYVLDKGKK
jgi:dipeptidyl aminopeptidase/acylaminoacyl peptidase